MLPPHSFPQLEKNLLLEVNAFINSHGIMPVFLCPIPEIVHGYPLQFTKIPLVSRELLRRLLAFFQNRPVLFKRSSFEDALCLG